MSIDQALTQVKENLQKEINILQNRILLSGTVEQDVKRVELELSTILNLSASLGIADEIRSYFIAFLNDAIVLPIDGVEIVRSSVMNNLIDESKVVEKVRKPRASKGLTQRDRNRIKGMVKEFLGIDAGAKPRESQLQFDLVAKIFDAGLNDLSDDLGAMEINDEFWKLAETAIVQAIGQVPPIIQAIQEVEEKTQVNLEEFNFVEAKTVVENPDNSVAMFLEFAADAEVDESKVDLPALNAANEYCNEPIKDDSLINISEQNQSAFNLNDIVRDTVTGKIGTVVDATPIKNFGGDQLLIKYVDVSAPTAIAFLELIQSADTIVPTESATNNQSIVESSVEATTIDDDGEEFSDEDLALLAKIEAINKETSQIESPAIPAESWF